MLGPKNFRQAAEGLFACGLPRRKDILWIVAEHGIRTVVDLTQRDRPTQRRACESVGVRYVKLPTAYDAQPIIPAGLEQPVLVFCFHGRDRTGLFIARWRELHAGS